MEEQIFFTIPVRKCYGSKEWVCSECGSLLNEVDDTTCNSCGRRILWNKAEKEE